MRPSAQKTIWTSVIGALALLAASGLVAAPQTRTVYAVRDAKIYPVSGPAIARGSIVIRNGLIEAVGANAQIPPEATVIDGAGLTVYPGLIDSLSDIGLPAPAASPGPSQGQGPGPGGGPPPQTQPSPKNTFESIFQTPLGLNPDRVLAEQVRADGRNVEAARNLGITSALVMSQDGILTGQSVLINTGSENLVVKAPIAQHVRFVQVRGGYPGTLMGVFAVLRQAYYDADWYRQIWDRFNTNPRGMERPKFDPMLEAMVPVTQGRVPFVLHANWENEIKRAVAFADELKIAKPVLAGGMEAARVASLLKARNIPVLVSVNYDTRKPKPGFGGDSEPAEYDEEELKSFNTNASVLQQAGVRFALHAGFSEPRQFIDNVRRTIENGLTLDQALRATTLSAAEILGAGDVLGSLDAGKIANVVVATGDPFQRDTQIKQVFVDGRLFTISTPVSNNQAGPGSGAPAGARQGAGQAAAAPARKAVVKPGSYITTRPRETLIKNATVLTITKGTIKNGSILIRDGKIVEVGPNVMASSDAKVIDATGRFVMPGIIDAHSHMAIEGGGNEGTSTITPNVRIADVIRNDDISIYRALAGGTTIVNVLHGSANAIGGTNAVLKLKWDRPVEEMFFGAPAGIKFALGENPKRSNSPPTPNRRWPATRMGVEESIRESFVLAQDYMKQWDAFEAARRRGENSAPPRRNLKLETLADILRGKILVHAHSYRADEIVALLNIADEFKFKIRSLQHVLEGYKVAKEIAAHGAGASTFADMWGYKMEAWDAIPQNPMIMMKFGVNVSVNSDSDERVRRLYQEAAKSVHYAGMAEDDALKMITINPAWQLGIENRVGSIEAGKDGDLAIFNAHPLSSYARVEMTLIEGQIFFDREQDEKTRGTGVSQ